MQANPIAASHGLILFTKSDNEFQIQFFQILTNFQTYLIKY